MFVRLFVYVFSLLVCLFAGCCLFIVVCFCSLVEFLLLFICLVVCCLLLVLLPACCFFVGVCWLFGFRSFV